MRIFATILAIVGLILTIIPSILVFTGKMGLDLHKQLMTAGTILWFVSAPIWFRKKSYINFFIETFQSFRLNCRTYGTPPAMLWYSTKMSPLWGLQRIL